MDRMKLFYSSNKRNFLGNLTATLLRKIKLQAIAINEEIALKWI